MAIDFFCPAKVYGAEKIALKNPFISAEFDRILKHMESNWVLCTLRTSFLCSYIQLCRLEMASLLHKHYKNEGSLSGENIPQNTVNLLLKFKSNC